MKRIAAPRDEQDQLIFLGEDLDSFQGELIELEEDEYDQLAEINFWDQLNLLTNSMIADFESEVIAGEEDLEKSLAFIDSEIQKNKNKILLNLRDLFQYALTHNLEVYFWF